MVIKAENKIYNTYFSFSNNILNPHLEVVSSFCPFTIFSYKNDNGIPVLGFCLLFRDHFLSNGFVCATSKSGTNIK